MTQPHNELSVFQDSTGIAYRVPTRQTKLVVSPPMGSYTEPHCDRPIGEAAARSCLHP